jgi:putative phosphoesterase
MMLAVIADVHSNLHALEAASMRISARSPDIVVCAGDVVGYGAFPNECCSKVEGLCSRSVAGNHDRAAISKDVSRMNPYAAAAAIWTSDRLEQSARRFLSALGPSARFVADDRLVAVFHGSPTDPDEYVQEDAVDRGLLDRTGCDILVLGHTHVPYVKSFDERFVLNPGSVGQPRDGDPRGSFAIVNTEKMDCEIVRFEYPVKEAADAILSEGLPRILAERLPVGR